MRNTQPAVSGLFSGSHSRGLGNQDVVSPLPPRKTRANDDKRRAASWLCQDEREDDSGVRPERCQASQSDFRFSQPPLRAVLGDLPDKVFPTFLSFNETR
jgi:hypothetical protein